MPLLRKGKYITPNLPDGQFCLVLNARQPNDQVNELMDVDGPFDSNQVVREATGAVTFVTEGIPYTIPVVKQEGDKLYLDGLPEPVRVERWPIKRA